jgi:glycerophosphoryl diester phosphodiesterase
MRFWKWLRKKSGVFFLILLKSLGGQMSCAPKKVEAMKVAYWTGKFPIMVIAHRGFSGAAPENTLIAFQKAIEVGSDMIEFDIRFSKDGRIVVMHDAALERTTNGEGKVADYTLKELKELDAGSKFSPKFAREKIPTLQEVLELAKDRVPVNIEIKNQDLGRFTIEELAAKALGEVKKAGMERQVIFSSFYPSALERIQELDPRIWVAFLFHRQWNSISEASAGRSFSVLNLRNQFLTKSKIAKIHEDRIKMNVYTVNAEEEMEQFVKWGVDGIITNHPEKLIQILQKR